MGMLCLQLRAKVLGSSELSLQLQPNNKVTMLTAAELAQADFFFSLGR